MRSIGTRERIGSDHRERRRVALAMRRRADPHGDVAGRVDVDGAELASSAGDLDVNG